MNLFQYFSCCNLIQSTLYVLNLTTFPMKQSFDIHHAPSSHNPFVVPEGYFTRFADELMRRIGAETVRPVVHPELPVVRWIPLIGAASIAALFVIFTQVILPSTASYDTTVLTAEETAKEKADIAYDYLLASGDADVTYYTSEYE